MDKVAIVYQLFVHLLNMLLYHNIIGWTDQSNQYDKTHPRIGYWYQALQMYKIIHYAWSCVDIQ